MSGQIVRVHMWRGFPTFPQSMYLELQWILQIAALTAPATETRANSLLYILVTQIVVASWLTFFHNRLIAVR